MDDEPLDRLLEQLCSGDTESAERVFRAYEPYLRMVVRRMLPAELRSKFDSIDVVQSMWADVLVGFREAGWRFVDANHLRAFLVKATRNRFYDRVRQHRTALQHEQSLEGTGMDVSSPAQQAEPTAEAQATELWERMLALCPPQHQELLRLKREGYSLAEIANQTGYHPSSVRRIFYDLARQMALK